MNPLVSIIIPVLNREHLILDTLVSIKKQTYINWECIIIDDGSNDNTIQVVEKFIINDKRYKINKRPNNYKKGGNGARNYGFEISNGEYINWFDSDDVMIETFLEKSINILDDNTFDFVLFDYNIVDESLDNIILEQKNLTTNLLEDYSTFKINFGTWAIVWKRDLVKDVKFNEKLAKAQDLDFNFRVFTNKNYNFININDIGLLHRSHDKSIVKDYFKLSTDKITSEIYARKNVLKFMILNKKETNVLNQCFMLYIKPVFKLLKIKLFFKLFSELVFIFKIDNRHYINKITWFNLVNFYLLIYLLFNLAETKFKKKIFEIKI